MLGAACDASNNSNNTGTIFMKPFAFFLGPIFLTIQLLVPAYGQSLPAPSRTVFKCESNGKVVYSDSPCLGAQRLDIQPTRGLDKATGVERVGKDVRQERTDEQMAKAWEPIFAETPEQRAKRHRRAALKPEARTQCDRLDQEIVLTEQAERRVTKSMLSDVQSDLMRLRRQYRESRC